MQQGLYVALSGQLSTARRMETIAQNVANAGTAGYRADAVKFKTVLSTTGPDPVAYTSKGRDYISTRSGPVIETGNPLDVAIIGDAWMAIDTPVGVVHTRDGRMRLTPEGTLETLNGHAVLDAAGGVLLIDPAAGTPAIARDGMISQAGRQIGAIGLYSMDPEARLSRYENSGIIPDRPAEPIVDFASTGLLQGRIEGANVNPVMELVKLIEVSRAFESAAAMAKDADESLSQAIRTLGSAEG